MPGAVWFGAVAVAAALGLLVVLVVLRPPKVDAARLRPDGGATANRRRTTADDTVAMAQRVLLRLDPGGRLERAVELGAVSVAAPDLLVVVGIGALVALLLGGVLGGLGLGLLLALLLPVVVWAWLANAAARRRKAFGEQLDDALQLLASSLRAGHSLLRAVDAVSRDSVAPMSDEFARVVNEVRVGRDLGESLLEVADRTRSDDFRWLVQAIGVHREVGGNLAEVLDRVGETLRDRAQLFRQARALSAEGRLSGMVLLAMPFVVIGFVFVTSPGYLAPLVSTSAGPVMVAFALILMAVGALWLRSIVKVRF